MFRYKGRVYVNGETAIEPYYYLRNGLIHIRYTVDRCIELSDSEIADLKKSMTENPSDKQGVLAKAWNFFSQCVGKPVIHDGVTEIDKRIRESRKNGCKN